MKELNDCELANFASLEVDEKWMGNQTIAFCDLIIDTTPCLLSVSMVNIKRLSAPLEREWYENKTG